MKSHKIKNISPTGAKVFLFLTLAATLGFASACRSGGDDKEGTITDAEAVQRAKSALMIRYAAGDSAESVTQNVTLPTAGANGVSISWASSDIGRISTTGTVSRPNDANTAVTLTATLTKNDARDERTFTLTVILLEDAPAVQQAKSALMLIYAAGDSAESVTQDVMLPASGANGVSISWVSSDATRISTTGTVSRPDDMNTEVILTATLTKNTTRDTRRFILTVTLPCGTTSELVTKLQAMPPSLSSCSAAGIRGANMTNLVSAGVTKEQLLAVWSADQDTGFTSAQLKAAGVTIAEMRSHGLTIAQVQTGGFSIADLRSGGFADHLVFNEACNTSSTFCTMEETRIECTANHPTITLTGIPLTATDTAVVLEGSASGALTWASDELMGAGNAISFTPASNVLEETIGRATARRLSDGGTNPIVSSLSIPLANVFSNPTVTITDGQTKNVNINLCPGPGS